MGKFIIGFLWVGGLLVAGSDGPLFPYANGVGLFVFVVASLILGTKLSYSIRNYRRRDYIYFNRKS